MVALMISASGCATSPRLLNREGGLLGGGGLLGRRTNRPSTHSNTQSFERELSLARLSERHGKPGESLKMYRAVLSKAPENQLALHRVGVIFAKQGELGQGLEHLQRAVELGDASAELLGDLGYCRFLAGDLDQAEDDLQAALDHDPQLKSARNNLGLVLGEQGCYDESLKQFMMAGTEAEAYSNLAFVKAQMGSLKEAEAHYHYALSVDRKLRPAAEGLIQVAATTGAITKVSQTESSQRAVNAALESTPARLAEAELRQPEPLVEKAPVAATLAPTPADVAAQIAAAEKLLKADLAEKDWDHATLVNAAKRSEETKEPAKQKTAAQLVRVVTAEQLQKQRDVQKADVFLLLADPDEEETEAAPVFRVRSVSHDE